MDKSERSKAIDAVDVLNDFIADCIAPVNVFRDYLVHWNNDESKEPHLSSVYRLCMSQIILTLYKWVEFYEKYHNFIPDDMRDECKLLLKKIKAKDIVYFRNSCIGHLWDNDKKQPLKNSEIDLLLKKITNGHVGNFMKWINNSDGNNYPDTVVSIVELLRDRIQDNYNVKPSEIIER